MDSPQAKEQAAIANPATPRVRGSRASAKGDETRRRIILHAIAEFSRKGYDGASTREVGKAARLTNTLVHYHFPTKEDLWKACARHLFAEYGRVIDNVDVSNVPEGRGGIIRAKLRAYFRLCLDNPAIPLFILHESQRDPTHLQFIWRELIPDSINAAIADTEAAQAAGILPPGDPAILFLVMFSAINDIAINRTQVDFFIGRSLDTEAVRAQYAESFEALFFRAPPEAS